LIWVSSLINPENIAIIGASKNPEKVGNIVLKNLIDGGFRGKIFPVNPSGGEIYGMKLYSSIKEIDNNIDIAAIIVPAKYVPDVITSLGEKNTRVCVIISAGFRESGKAGLLLEKEVQRRSAEHNIRIIGPNCVGLINTSSNLNLTFGLGMPPDGNIAFISQSGAVITSAIDWIRDTHCGFSKVFSLGNKADLNEADFLELLLRDERTSVIAGYIEDIRDGEKFVEIASKVSREKPIILIKAGETRAGSRAASSHTGSITGSKNLYDALFKKCNIVKVGSINELLKTSIFFSKKIISGRRFAIITNAGGPGIIAADGVEKNNLIITKFSKETIERLRKSLPSEASIQNPVDVLGDATPERFRDVLEIVSGDKNVDTIFVIVTPQAMTDSEGIAETIISTSKESKRNICASFIGGQFSLKAKNRLKENDIPVFDDPIEGLSIINLFVNYNENLLKDFSKNEIKKYISNIDRTILKRGISILSESGEKELTAFQALRFFREIGFKTPEGILVKNEEEAIKCVGKIKFPLVMKVASPDISHKTDVGGVKINITDINGIKNAWKEILFNIKKYAPSSRINGITMEEMVNGFEMILGFKREPDFGVLIMLGMGGIYVEVLKDIAFGLCPLKKSEIEDMVTGLKVYRLLTGYRGKMRADIPALIDSVVLLSEVVYNIKEMKEGEINPLIVREEGKGVVAVDGRIIIG